MDIKIKKIGEKWYVDILSLYDRMKQMGMNSACPDHTTLSDHSEEIRRWITSWYQTEFLSWREMYVPAEQACSRLERWGVISESGKGAKYMNKAYDLSQKIQRYIEMNDPDPKLLTFSHKYLVRTPYSEDYITDNLQDACGKLARRVATQFVADKRDRRRFQPDIDTPYSWDGCVAFCSQKETEKNDLYIQIVGMNRDRVIIWYNGTIYWDGEEMPGYEAENLQNPLFRLERALYWASEWGNS